MQAPYLVRHWSMELRSTLSCGFLTTNPAHIHRCLPISSKSALMSNKVITLTNNEFYEMKEAKAID